MTKLIYSLSIATFVVIIHTASYFPYMKYNGFLRSNEVSIHKTKLF